MVSSDLDFPYLGCGMDKELGRVKSGNRKILRRFVGIQVSVSGGLNQEGSRKGW